MSNERQEFFLSVLVTAAIAAPLTFCVVAIQWMALDPALAPQAVHNMTLSLMRSFVKSFDLLMLSLWVPCAAVIRRVRLRGAQ